MDITGIESIADAAKSIIERIWPPDLSPAEKAKAQVELEQIMSARENALITAQRDIIVAELQQGDNYTKRARPTFVYAGLAFIFFVHVFIPLMAFFKGTPVSEYPNPSLPDDFWWAWGGVVGTWMVARSYERLGKAGKFMSQVTGSKKSG